MKPCLRILCLLFLVTGTLTQDFGLDLADALDNLAPTPAKPTDPPKKDGGGGGGDFGLDLADAFDEPNTPTKKPPAPVPPKTGGGGGGGGFDLLDAFGDTNSPTKKPPAPVPPKSGGGGGGGGGGFGDSDLFDVSGGDYKPDGGKSGGRGVDPAHDPHGGADQPQQEAGSGQIAGIASAIGMALLGAASSYFAYQKKKLCFKIQGGTDPESGKSHGTHSEPQVLSNLLNTS